MTRSNAIVFGLLTAFALLGSSGCASVMCGRYAEVGFHSNVPGAQVRVIDPDGHEVGSTHTPGKVTLRRQRGWIKPDEYTAQISAPGYKPVKFPIKQKVNPWIWGNALFSYVGGPVGLVVDNMTGAAWVPKEDTLYRELTPVVYASRPAEEDAVENYVETKSANPQTNPIAVVSDQPPERLRDDPQARLVSFEENETLVR